MKKSIFSAGLMFLGAVLLVVGLLMTGPKAYSGSRVQDDSGSPTPVAPASSPAPVVPATSPTPVGTLITLPTASAQPTPYSYAQIAIDNAGDIIGMLMGNPAPIPGDTNNVKITVKPPDLNKSGVYFPVYVGSPTPTPASVTLTVPATVLVAFCSGGSSYNKATGQCTDGKFPTKMVPTGSLSDPMAQTPNVVCRAPRVPTYNPAMKKWLCIVPAGFKNTLGE